MFKVLLVAICSVCSLSSSNTLNTTSIIANYVLKPVNLELSAYCSCSICSDEWGTMTASGEVAREGIVAAPKEIPFDTKYSIPGVGNVVVKDRGGAIYITDDNFIRLDVYMNNHEEAKSFGRKRIVGYEIIE